ncbi:MAG: ferritin-like domain-containing protein [Desulfuromonadales bacterium]
MEKKEIVRHLYKLAQLDIDAWHAYGQAMEKIENALDVRDRLERYRGDHHRHVVDLSAKIRELEGEPPDFAMDFKGFLISGFTSLRSVTGAQGALAAMETNEKLTNRNYAEAVQTPGFPSDIHALLEANYQDEKEHLRYVEDRLDFLVREKGGAGRSQRY